MTKYYVDLSGNYLGGFDGSQPPPSAIEIPNPPEHGWDKWINGAWVPNKDRLNNAIKAQLAELDVKRIRPLAEGDSVYLAQLNDQIAVLRAQLL